MTNKEMNAILNKVKGDWSPMIEYKKVPSFKSCRRRMYNGNE